MMLVERLDEDSHLFILINPKVFRSQENQYLEGGSCVKKNLQ